MPRVLTARFMHETNKLLGESLRFVVGQIKLHERDMG